MTQPTVQALAPRALARMTRRALVAEGRVAAVLALHFEEHLPRDSVITHGRCVHDGILWPCPTFVAAQVAGD